MTGERQMLHPLFIQGTIGCSASLIVLRKIMGHILFEAISGQVKEKVIWNNSYDLTVGKSCFLNFIAL